MRRSSDRREQPRRHPRGDLATSDADDSARCATARSAARCWTLPSTWLPARVVAPFVDVHHIDPRADGGDHDPENIVTACGAHHRAVHRGELIITGRVTEGLRVRHSDGSPYGGRVDARRAETASKLSFALRHMGFREMETRRAIESAATPATHVGADDLTALLPRALAFLRPAPV